MCVMSAVMGGWTNPFDPNYIEPTIITPDLAQQMLEVLEKLDNIDKAVKAKDCSLEESYKEKYIKLLERIASERQKIDP